MRHIFNPSWKLVYEKSISTATTSLTISGLDGNQDVKYMIVTRFRSDAGAVQCRYLLRPNNDSLLANYGRRYLRTSGASVSTATDSVPGLWLGRNDATGHLSLSEALLFAKSGYERIMLANISDQITGTSVGRITDCCSVWNNTADNITSLVLLANQTNGIGVGSHIQIFKYEN